MRDFIAKIFNIDSNEESFQSRFAVVFNERDPKHLGDFVPYFTDVKTLSDSLPVNFLYSDGIQALKEI
jgi:hypothetical protein